MKVAVLGYGTVGSGVVEVIERNELTIAKRAGEEVKVKYVLDLRDFPGNPVQKILTHDFRDIADDPEVEIVVETMGGTEPAYTFVKECLLKGKSVCTSNKELVAKHGAELLEIARQKKCNFLFEASVGGGIPIMRPLNQSLTVDEILEISGILNGTTNYILTKMSNEGCGYEEVLKEAQAKGYAERNPEADVEGYDAGRKLAILTSMAYGMQVDYEDIYMEGITKLSRQDFAYAKSLGGSIKLIGRTINTSDGYFAMVTPRLIGSENPLYNVNDVFNAIMVHGNMLGEVMFYGKGAGKLPTASAVVSDVVDATKHRERNIMTIWSPKKLGLSDHKLALNAFLVRVKAEDKDLAREIFGEVKEVKAEGVNGEFAFLTKVMTEAEFDDKASKVNVLGRIRTDIEA